MGFTFQVPTNYPAYSNSFNFCFFVYFWVIGFCFSVLNFSQCSWSLHNRDECARDQCINLTLAKLPFRSGYLPTTCSLKGNLLPENSTEFLVLSIPLWLLLPTIWCPHIYFFGLVLHHTLLSFMMCSPGSAFPEVTVLNL